MIENIRILYVDDGLDEVEMYTFALARRGAHVVTAATAEEALHIAAVQRFDVIVSDVSLPRMDGLALMRELRRLGVRSPSIALTGWAGDRGRSEALEAGFDDHRPKPCTPSELVEAIGELLGRDKDTSTAL